MRYLSLFFLCFAILAAAETEVAPPPQMPAEVTLTSGRVLRQVTVIRWEKDRVVLKHAGGADPIPFSLFKSPSPDELPAIRAGWLAAAVTADNEKKIKQAAADLEAKRPIEYSGVMFAGAPSPEAQVLNETKSREPSLPPDAYKLAGMPVYILPPEALSVFATGTGNYVLPKPLFQTLTDANGQFSFTLPANQKFVIFAQSGRRTGGGIQLGEWRVSSDDIKNPRSIQLGNHNRRPVLCTYTFTGK